MKTLRETLLDAERAYLQEVLAAAKGNVTAAARIAGVNRSTFYRRLHSDYIPTCRYYNRGNAAWKSLNH